MDASHIHVNLSQKNIIPVASRMAGRKLTACYGYSNVLQEIRGINKEDEFIMIPFLSASGNKPWVATMPSAYLGVNSHTAEDEEKMEAALRILELFASPEGQAAVIKDTQSDTSCLTSEAGDSPTVKTGLESYVKAGYVYNLNRFNSDMLWLISSSLVQVCTGDMEMSGAMAAIDKLNENGTMSYSEDHTLIGSVSADLLYEGYNTRKEETAIGNLVADAVAELAGVDIAFVNGGGIRASLYKGDVYTSDLAEVCPYGNTIVILDVTGETIRQMLENSIGSIFYTDIPGGRFLQVSGLHYTFLVDESTEDLSDEGNRIPAAAKLTEVTLPDGTAIEEDKTYRIAVNNYMCGSSGYADDGDGYTMLNVFDSSAPAAAGAVLVEYTGKTYADAIIAYFNNHNKENIGSSPEGRITVRKAGR